MKKVIRLTESDLLRIVKRVINEQLQSDIAGTPPSTRQPKNNQSTVRNMNIIRLSGGVKFVINNNRGFSSGSVMDGVTSQLGPGNFIIFNQIPPVPGTSLTLDFIKNTDVPSAIVRMLSDKVGFMKDANMYGLDNRGVMDFLSLVCRGFYGNVTTDGVVNLLTSLRMLQQNQSNVLGPSIMSNFESIFRTIVSISSMSGNEFYTKFPTNLVSNKWGAGGQEMKSIYNASIKYLPGNIKRA